MASPERTPSKIVMVLALNDLNADEVQSVVMVQRRPFVTTEQCIENQCAAEHRSNRQAYLRPTTRTFVFVHSRPAHYLCPTAEGESSDILDLCFSQRARPKAKVAVPCRVCMEVQACQATRMWPGWKTLGMRGIPYDLGKTFAKATCYGASIQDVVH